MIDCNETVELVCKTATVNEKSGDHKSALFKLVLYNKKLHPKGDKGGKSSLIRKLFCLLILLNISKDWTKSARERGEREERGERRGSEIIQEKISTSITVSVQS